MLKWLYTKLLKWLGDVPELPFYIKERDSGKPFNVIYYDVMLADYPDGHLLVFDYIHKEHIARDLCDRLNIGVRRWADGLVTTTEMEVCYGNGLPRYFPEGVVIERTASGYWYDMGRDDTFEQCRYWNGTEWVNISGCQFWHEDEDGAVVFADDDWTWYKVASHPEFWEVLANPEKLSECEPVLICSTHSPKIWSIPEERE